MYSTEKLNTILQEYGGFLGGIVSIWLVIANEEESLDIVFKDKAWCAKFHGEHIQILTQFYQVFVFVEPFIQK